MRHTRKTVPLLLLVLGLCLSLTAQTQFGTITGRVTDPQGAVIPEAKVALTNEATHSSQSVTTGSMGTYAFAAIPAGEYTLSVEKTGFSTTRSKLTLTVAQRVTQDIAMKVGGTSNIVTVEATSEVINTTSGDVSRTVTSQELQTLPLATKNPYGLILLADGAIDSASATGDARGQGFVVNGQRSSSINYMLDGTENNETFATGPAALIPNDAVQEFRLQTNNMSSEFGRNAIVTNVITRSGSNAFHGSASEFYRGAALTANTVDNNARGVDKPNFVRNDFTFSVGGPIIKDRTFFFASLEGVRVRSSGNAIFFVPTQQFLSHVSPDMATYVTAVGLPSSNSSDCITAGQFATLNGAAPLVDANTLALIPASDPLFCSTSVNGPIDAGGGVGGNTWNAVGKLDHRFTPNTLMSFRYAFTDIQTPAGGNSISPYSAFNTGLTFRSENYSANVTHSFSNSLVSESRLSFSRTIPQAPLGSGDVNIPCIQFGNFTNTPGGIPIVFPGYLPAACAALALPSGGPQNTISAGTGFTYSKGKHTIKWGGAFSALRDNHTFGAFANGSGIFATPQNVINGIVSNFSVAFDPKGKVPGDLYNTAVDGPFQAPLFKRHYRYNEVSFYGEDAIRLTNRFTLTLGLRWEYFGVLHSPDAEKALDANFFLDATGQPASLNPGKTIFEQIRDGRFSRTGNLFNQDWNNFGPRVGFAWDVFGDGGTSVRGGYGMFYDKNFGNALFNVIQNPPNYNVANIQGGAASIDVNQYVLLANLLGPGNVLIGGSARMLDRDIQTAYSQQWNASIEHNLLKKGVILSATYVGTKGDKLYSLNNINQRGSCLLAPAGSLATCTPGGSRTGRLNQTGVTGLNRRGNEGYSRYHGISFEAKTRSLHGLTLNSSYTYAQSKDNSSSFFGDSAFIIGFGFRDPFNPSLDYANSENDIRHRYVLSYNWDIPWAKNLRGPAKHILDGWSFSGVYSAQTGGTFSVFDNANFDSQCALSATNLCYPLLTGAVPSRTQTPIAGAPNAYTLYNLTGVFTTQATQCAGDLACTADLYLRHADTLAPRNMFRLPGLWNYDAALAKHVRITERVGLDLRLEAFNLFNHSNLYAVPGTNDANLTEVQASYGLRPAVNANGVFADRRSLQLGVKVTF